MLNKKLLVADDSLTIQKVIRLALSNEGYEIQAVSDGNDVLQQISLFRPSIVLIDVSLPNKDAFELKREIDQHDDLRSVRFILMSSAFEKFDEATAESLHFSGRLTKPFDPAHLRQVISSVLADIESLSEQSTTFIQRPTSPPASPSSSSLSLSTGESTPTISFEEPLPPLPPSLEMVLEAPSKELSSTLSLELTPAPPPPPLELPPAIPAAHSAAPPSAPLSDNSLHEIRKATEAEDLPPISELWDQDPDFEGTSLDRNSNDDDIKKLTESTIRESGLDDFSWSVSESSIKSLDRPPPPPLSRSSNPPSMLPPAPPRDSGAAAISGSNLVSREELEGIVKKQVEESIAHLTQQILPEIAERLLKEEIHKILNEL
jgi:two-component system cell cycle response regulator